MSCCCDSGPATVNSTCTWEYYSKREDLFLNFDYMINAKPYTVAMAMINIYLLVVTVTHVLRRSRRGYVPWALRSLPLCVFSCLMYIARSLADLYSTDIGIAGCEAIHWLSCVFYGLGSTHVYTILWCRQRTLYADPLLKPTVTKKARSLSKITIVAIYILMWLLVIIFQLTYCTVSSPFGCIVIWDIDNTNILVVVVILVFMLGSTFFHVLLLGLIAYPLMLNEQSLTCCSALRKLWSPAQNDIERLLKRLFYCTALCILSSQAMGLLMMLDALSVIRLYLAFPVQLDMLISNFAAVCAFSDWKQWLNPCAKPTYTENKHQMSI